MSLLKWRPGLLSAPVGNNHVNNPEDILNMKDAYARVGRYTKPITNGYIDAELNNAIHGIQRDYNLKRDGYMKPGGETEATLIGEALGIEKKPEAGNIKLASAAPVIPALARMFPAIAGSAMEAWQLWQKQSKDKRESVLDDILQNDVPVPVGDPNEKPHCEEQRAKDGAKCSKAYHQYINTYGSAVANRAEMGCEACAEQRYGDCRGDRPIRPLQYWTPDD